MKKWILGLAAFLAVSLAQADGPIQNEDVKGPNDITAAVLTTTGNLSNVSQCITSPGSTTGLSVGLFVYDTTNPTFIASGTTIIGLPGSCSAGQIKISSTPTNISTGDTLTFGGQLSQLVGDNKIYVAANGINQTLNSAIQGGLIGGGGSGSGVNLLSNAGFETGLGFWSHTGGTFSAVTSGSNLLIGKGSATFLASGSGQFVNSNLYPIPNGLKNTACIAQVLYLGGDSNLFLEATDGTNVLGSVILSPVSQPTVVAVPFICPSSGSMDLRVVSIASSSLVAIDQTFLGQNQLIQVSQANLFGTVIVPSNCNLSANAGGDVSDGGTCVGATVTGGFTSFTSGNGQINVTNMPPGEYELVTMGSCYNNTANSNVSLNFTDGVSISSQAVNLFSPGDTTNQIETPCTIRQHFSYPVAGNRIFKLQAGGTVVHGIVFPFTAEAFTMYRYPSQSQLAVIPETINWRLEAYQNNANIDLGFTVGTVAQYAVDGTNSLTINNTGTIAPVLEPCSGTGSAVGSSCTGGTFPQIGIVFTPPAAARIQVCATFSVEDQAGGGSTSIYNSFQLFQTSPTNDATTVASGPARISTSIVDPGSGEIHGETVHICGDFNVTATLSAFRLFNTAIVSGVNATRNNILGTTNAGGGPSNVYWTARPLTQNMPAPVIIHGITSQSPNAIQLETVGVSPVCTSSPCTINSQSSSWLTSITRLGPGVYQLNTAPGNFTNSKVCMCNAIVGGSNRSTTCISDGNEVLTSDGATSGLSDSQFNVWCFGY